VVSSDGCSHGTNTNEHRTDIGARILCHAAYNSRHRLRPITELGCNDQSVFFSSVAAEAQSAIRVMRIGDQALAATLLILSRRDDIVQGFVFGDGVMGCKNRDGSWHVSVVDYPSGAPYYLLYDMDPDSRKKYLSEFGTTARETHYFGDINSSEIEVEFKEWDVELDSPVLSVEVNQKDCEFAFIISDGAQSFRHDSKMLPRKEIDVREVIALLCDFKNFRGDFTRRHCEWIFKKNLPDTFKKNGWINDDDVSLGVLYCGEREYA
jgi:hypothetical protein